MKSNKIFEERTEVYGEMVVRSGVNHQMQGKRSGRIGKAACCVGLCLLMLLGINRYVPEQSYGEVTVSEEDIENLRQNLKEVEEAIDRQKDHLSEMNRDLSTMQMALTNYGALLKEYYKEIEEAQERKTALEEAIRKNVSDNALLTAEREELHKDYLRTLRALRENRDTTTLELIFDSRSLEEFLSGLERAKDLSEYKQKLLEKMDEKFEKIDAEKAKLEQGLQDQNLRYEKLVELGRQAEEKIADTERDLTELAAEILETENRILELTETTEEVQKELTELIRERERQLEIERQKELGRLEELELKSIDTDGEMSAFATPGHHSVLVLSIALHSRWYEDGLRANTAILTLNGRLLNGAEHLIALCGALKPGDKMVLGVRTMFNDALEIHTRR